MKLYLSLILALAQQGLFAQNGIKPMVCEGPIPGDLKQSISEIVNQNSNNDFKKKTLLGIYDIFASGKVVYGNESWKMVNAIGQRILEKNGIDSTVKFYLLRSSLYNAFATDEGYIFATTALLANVKTEDELAFVLCHELSHFILKHNLKSDLDTKKKLSELKKTLNKLRDENKQLKSLDNFLRSYYAFSQANELEADSMGIILYLKAGFSPGSVRQSLSNLEHNQPLFYNYKINMHLIDPGMHTSKDVKKFDTLILKNAINKQFSSKYYSSTEPSETAESTDDAYLTHPDWKVRINRGDAILSSLNTTEAQATSIRPLIASQCLSEMVITEYKLGHFFEALTYLNILEQLQPGHTDIAQLKGICLSAIYLNFQKDNPSFNHNIYDSHSALSNLYYQMLVFEFKKLRYLALYYTNISMSQGVYKKMCQHYTINIIGTKDINSSTAEEEVLTIKTHKKVSDTCLVKHPFMKIVESFTSHINSDTMTRSYKNYTDSKQTPRVVFTIDDSPMRWKNEVTDSMILLSPNFYAIPGKRTSKWNDPMVKFERKDYFQNALIERASSNSLHYNVSSFENKETLTTEQYNQYYQLRDMISEYINHYNSNFICPMSVLVVDSIIRQTGCKKMQFIQLSHFRKNTMESVLVLADIYVLPFALITSLDIPAYIRSQFTKSTAINVIFDLENATAEHISILETSLKIDNAGITAISQRVVSETKNYLKTKKVH